MSAALELVALSGMPMVREGDDVAALIIAALGSRELRQGDVVVVAQKIVSKAEGRTVDLATVVPTAEAEKLAAEVGKDPRLVQVILGKSTRVVRSRPNLIIVQHRLGFVMANAGIDQSNVAAADGVHRVLLLPRDPDASAEATAGEAGTALRRSDRCHHQRQFRSRLAPRHVWHRDRCGGTAKPDRPARPA